ncbi:dethiobiotin synthase [Rhodoblastus sphagnicola]|uniref:dethiobiotin synthase n=1 Tax=Rhodoblastus sphagnicola TaxID=333368 RepID=UPI0013049F69|nr:dethiobiotin synthase [Rhodoblastus sphagnicola]
MQSFFVTSTGTGVGKTYTTCALIRQARALGKKVAATKPLISGFDKEKIAESDTGAILAALGEDLSEANARKISPWRFAAPLAPNMAAAAEGRAVDCDALFAHSRAFLAEKTEVALIEGVGGVMVPLDARKTVLDWIAASGAPAILVVGAYLGTISHTLTAVEVLQMRKIPLAAVIVNEGVNDEVPFAATRAELAARLATKILPLRRGAAGETLRDLLSPADCA